MNYKQGEVQNWDDIAKILAGGAALGGGARAGIGLAQMLSHMLSAKKLKAPPPVIIDLPYHQQQQDVAPLAKVAVNPTLTDVLTDPRSWDLTTKIVGAPLAALGGYTAIDKLLKWQRQRSARQDLEDSRNAYRSMVIGARRPLDPEQLNKVAELYSSLLSGPGFRDPAFMKAAEMVDRYADTVMSAEPDAAKEQESDPLQNWVSQMKAPTTGGRPPLLPDQEEEHGGEKMAQEPYTWEGAGRAIASLPTWIAKKLVGENGVPGALTEYGQYLNPLNWPNMTKDIAVPVADKYLAGAAGLGLMAGGAGYNYARKEDPDTLKAKAMKDQLEANLLTESPQVFARLVPTARK